MLHSQPATHAKVRLASRTGKLVMGILALIAEFENDIRRERQMDGIAKASGIKFTSASVFPPEADICWRIQHVCLVP